MRSMLRFQVTNVTQHLKWHSALLQAVNILGAHKGCRQLSLMMSRPLSQPGWQGGCNHAWSFSFLYSLLLVALQTLAESPSCQHAWQYHMLPAAANSTRVKQPWPYPSLQSHQAMPAMSGPCDCSFVSIPQQACGLGNRRTHVHVYLGM